MNHITDHATTELQSETAPHTAYLSPRAMQKIALALAVLASAVSLGIAVCAGLQRAGTSVEQFWSVALSVIMVLVSHLMPLFWRLLPRRSGLARLALLALWFIAWSMVLRGQAEFLALAQAHAADQRVHALPATAYAPLGNASSARDLTTIAQQIAEVTTELAHVEARRCSGECRAVRARKVSLAAQLVALNVEADEAKRRDTERDRLREQASRVDELRVSRRADPVTSVVARWVGMTEARLNLLLDFACLAGLEGATSFLWYVVGVVSLATDSTAAVSHHNATASRSGAAVRGAAPKSEERAVPTQSRAAHITRHNEVASKSGRSKGDSDDDRLIEEIREAIAAGKIKRNLVSIRQFLRCGQGKAVNLNRLYVERFGDSVPEGGGA
ncbi:MULTISPECIES: hypothetical protein [unclassified Caballeronia]|uniref:hypothetical protein n=1 Tax=unclassified Caballeronia TaxID=2646786 RepID=UPI0020287B23|nr:MULTISPECIES: hypothetical protein [unclassified Caballeronia]